MTGLTDVLLIYTDQLRWDALGCAGGTARTPEIDRLAAAGVRFDRAIVQSPVCMPSRASLLTGRYPSDLHVTQNGIPVPEQTETIATHMAAKGWRTANIGKLHFLPHANRDHRRPHPPYGFDTLVLSDEPGTYEDDYRAWVRAQSPEALDHVSVGLPPAAAEFERVLGLETGITHPVAGARDDYDDAHVFGAEDDLTHTAWVATRTIEHLRSLGVHEPALTVASFFAPHAPYRVPQRFYDLYDRDALPLPTMTDLERDQALDEGLTDEKLRTIAHGYFAAISEVDFHVGRILDELESLGRADRTMVLFVSDHGEWLGDHGRLTKGYPADDPVSRVPLIVRWNDVVRPGRVVATVVEMLDVAPTVFEACGLQVPPDLQGRSLLGHLVDEPESRLAVAVTEHDDWTSLRSETHHYVVHASGLERLWDVIADPHEQRDLAQEEDAAPILAEHRALLIRRQLLARRTHHRPWPY